jgi:hypothetical protein
MPVAALLGRSLRNDDHVSGRWGDLLLAAGADVALAGLEGMHEADRDALIVTGSAILTGSGSHR